jgi:8-oxo-dGTP pyrophosphatase MutT (NUDIX family)
MIERGDVGILLERFEPDGDGEAAKSKELVAALLDLSLAPFSRSQFNPGHITCSGMVFRPDRDGILLVLHRRLRRWLLPGGHVEADDPHIGDAARREVMEETGAVLRRDREPLLVGVDVHGIPPRRDEPFHLHHDLIFRFQAEAETFLPSAEVREVTWCSSAEFDRYQLPGSLRRGYARAKASI